MFVLLENLFVDLIDIELAEWIKEETLKDTNYVKLNQDKKVEKSIWDSKEVVISEGNIFIDGKQYIPDNIALKKRDCKKITRYSTIGSPRRIGNIKQGL